MDSNTPATSPVEGSTCMAPRQHSHVTTVIQRNEDRRIGVALHLCNAEDCLALQGGGVLGVLLGQLVRVGAGWECDSIVITSGATAALREPAQSSQLHAYW